MATGLVALIFWVIKRRAAKADDPLVQNQNRYDQIAKDISTGKSVPLTVHATADLDELDRLLDGKSG